MTGHPTSPAPTHTAALAATTTPAALSAWSRIRSILLRFGVVWILLLLAVFASVLYPGFFYLQNINNMIAQVAAVGIVAVGMTFVIIGGGFDLSVAAIYAAGTVTFASLSNVMPVWTAFALTLVIAMLAGWVNGFVVTVMKVNPFIATLATASLFSAAAYLYSNSQPVLSTAEGFNWLGTAKVGGIWVSTFFLAGVLIIGAIVLHRTSFGRSVFAVGGNREAARLVGIRVNWITSSTFAISAVCAGLGGMIIASQTGVGQANIGATVTLDAITIVIVGGTALLGGEGAMWRTVVGILVWATLKNLFSALALSTFTQLLLQGGILLLAVSLDVLARRGTR
ncbi:ABC transporter permease [Cnuibacter physcomitrellae]|uniref:ABC transporter permease n=1 Tax=Cnuibacter physcomitrellae TaxID=1619308 RepID=UPI0021757E37|nr:ABC transporter permease [Cnuibacter physcomitrellae]MCS5498334.1 ABC transporter permease [Cnuibacter physcomitrellae]